VIITDQDILHAKKKYAAEKRGPGLPLRAGDLKFEASQRAVK
jgi:hypothetical protein